MTATRIEGGAKVCVYCNRVLTFNFMERPAPACDCQPAAPTPEPPK